MIYKKRFANEAQRHFRSIAVAVDRDLSRLENSCDQERLKKNWTELLGLLDLGPEREYRECPSCHNMGMSLASRCGFCWIKLTPDMVLLPEAGNKKTK